MKVLAKLRAEPVGDSLRRCNVATPSDELNGNERNDSPPCIRLLSSVASCVVIMSTKDAHPNRE